MLHSPKAIANYFLDLAQASGQGMTPMKLQKLVYYANGWYAGYTGQPLIDEAVEAWPYGPVIPSLYHEFKRYGSAEIDSRAREEGREVQPPADTELRQFLDNVWKQYGQFTGIRLSEMTHALGSPWDLTWKAAAGVRNAGIPFELIARHFKQAADTAQQRTHQS